MDSCSEPATRLPLVIVPSGQVDKLHRLHCETMQASYYGFVNTVSSLAAANDSDRL